MQCFDQRVRLFSDAKNRLGSKGTKIKTCMYTVGAYKYDVVSATAGPVTDTYFELKMLYLFYFVLKSENTGMISRLQWYMRNNSIFPSYILSFFYFNS